MSYYISRTLHDRVRNLRLMRHDSKTVARNGRVVLVCDVLCREEPSQTSRNNNEWVVQSANTAGQTGVIIELRIMHIAYLFAKIR